MAKRCNVCKKTYADNLRSCPYCAEEVEEAVELEEAPSEKARGGKIPPKKPAPKPTMVADEIDILAEEVVEAPGKGKPAAAAPPGDLKKTHLAARTAQSTTLAKKSPAPTMIAPDDAGADIVDAVVDEEGSRPPKKPKTAAPKTTSRADDEHLAEAVDLGTLPGRRPGGSGSESGDKKDKKKEGAGSAIELHGGEVLVEGASEVNLGATPADKGERPSGLDLIAEAVESGVELEKGKTGGAGKRPSAEQEAADILADESSAVDLGSSADMTVNPFSVEEHLGAPSDKPAAEKARAEAKGVHEETVDLAAAATAEADAEAAEAAEEASLSGRGGVATLTKAPPKPRYGRHWAGGILVGLLLAVVVVVALAVFTNQVKVAALDGVLVKTEEKKGPSREDTLAKSQLAKAQQESDDAKKQLDAERTATNTALAASAKAKEDVAKLKKQLDDEKAGRSKSETERMMELAKAKDDAKKAGAALADVNKLLEGLQASLKDVGFEAATAKEVPDQLKKLLATKKTDDALLADTSKLLKVEKEKLPATVMKLDADKKAIEAERTRLDAIVKTVRDKLKESKFLVGDAVKDDIVLAGLDKALKQAVSPLVTAMSEAAKVAGDITGSMPGVVAKLYDLTRPVQREALLGYYKVREPLVQTPQKMLDTWIPLLQDMDRGDAANLSKKATIDANWVKKQDIQATAADKAKADYILGLALRNELKYAEARKVLEPIAASADRPSDPAWKKNARLALWQITDPLAYYLRYSNLKMQGKLDRMLVELDAGVKAADPAHKGALLALYSVVRLDKAQGAAKKLDGKMPEVVKAEADAKAAVTAGAVEEGNYALGLRAELLGDLEGARKHYQVASRFKGRRDLASLYRLALARVLLQAAPADEKKPAEDKKPASKDKNEKTSADTPRAHLTKAALVRQIFAAKKEATLTPAEMLLVLNVVLLAADDDDEADTPKNSANIEAALKLAREAIDLGDPRGYFIMGTALTQKNEWTRGLGEYITGLEKLFPGPATEGLRRIFEDHPAFKIPDSARPPQPLVAEKHYAAGLAHFWDGKYNKAEQEFVEAVRFFDKDARYYYYLGLAQLLQKPARVGAANESFRLAKHQEDQGNPDPEEVNAALERVQGPARKVISRLRQKP